mmetsp:Transcript_65673/g.169043  ORF Transcript_65673/g.169043 Transcript_65673/m.169043 type:complete len:200 (+) Transcript_65673:491-1090(+)
MPASTASRKVESPRKVIGAGVGAGVGVECAVHHCQEKVAARVVDVVSLMAGIGMAGMVGAAVLRMTGASVVVGGADVAGTVGAMVGTTVAREYGGIWPAAALAPGRVAIQCRELVSELPLAAAFWVSKASRGSACMHLYASTGSITASSRQRGQDQPLAHAGSFVHSSLYTARSCGTQSAFRKLSITGVMGSSWMPLTM